MNKTKIRSLLGVLSIGTLTGILLFSIYNKIIPWSDFVIVIRISIALITGLAAFWLTGLISTDITTSSLLIKSTGGFAVFITVIVLLQFTKKNEYEGPFLGGQWMYSLYDKYTQKMLYGTVFIDQSDGCLNFENGNVWYYDNFPNQYNRRGVWFSKVAQLKNDKLYVIFELKNTSTEKETENVETFEGLIIFDGINKGQLAGEFQDMRPRADHWGTVVANKFGGDSDPSSCVNAYRYYLQDYLSQLSEVNKENSREITY